MSKPLEEETQWPAVDKESRRWQRRWDLLHSSGPQAQEPNRKRRVDSWGGCKWEAPPGPVPQMRLHVFWNRWGHWQVFFSLRSLLI